MFWNRNKDFVVEFDMDALILSLIEEVEDLAELVKELREEVDYLTDYLDA